MYLLTIIIDMGKIHDMNYSFKSVLHISVGLLVFLVLPVQASAANVFLEPYVGTGVAGKVQATMDGTTTDLMTFRGMTFGGRAGLKFGRLFFLGGDYSLTPTLAMGYPMGASSLQFGSTPSLSTQDKMVRAGAVFGVKLPLLFRFWVGYNFKDQLTNSSFTLNGNSMKAGIGLSPLPFVSLNFEYIRIHYTSMTVDGVTGDLDSSSSLDGSLFLMSLSIPLGL